MKNEFVQIELKQPDGSYRGYKYFVNCEHKKYIPTSGQPTWLPNIDFGDVNLLSNIGVIRDLKQIEK